jgi:hypothetical protein
MVYGGNVTIIPGDRDRVPARSDDAAAISGITAPAYAIALPEFLRFGGSHAEPSSIERFTDRRGRRAARQQLYGLRKQNPEPVFGIIKSVMGFRLVPALFGPGLTVSIYNERDQLPHAPVIHHARCTSGSGNLGKVWHNRGLEGSTAATLKGAPHVPGEDRAPLPGGPIGVWFYLAILGASVWHRQLHLRKPSIQKQARITLGRELNPD